MFEFKISRKDQKTVARTASFYTPHGKIRTPVFMPVGTYGAVKTLTPDEIWACGSEIILANTFHLHLRPGEDLIAKFGGIHKFMSWDGPILTDSGGFQVFSLAKMRKISDQGVEFRSPLDGSKIYLTPKKALQIQQKLGSDIAMQLDECAPADASRKVAETALYRTMKWAEESLKFQKNTSKQALFPIVQGVNFPNLRKESAKFCASLPTSGIAIRELRIKNEYTITIADKKLGYFKTPLPSVILENKNPYTSTQEMQNVVIVKKEPFYRKPWFWTSVGVGVGLYLNRN